MPVDVVLWLFLLYSCAGVLIEGVFCLVLNGRLELRLGLLYLPLRPIYGLGGVACTLLLTPLLDRPVAVFALSSLICSAVEFLASWKVEKVFRTVSWDYSDKWLHLQGRICLQYSVGWGLLAAAALYGCHPFVAGAVQQPGPRPGETVLTALMMLMSLSVVLTLAALARARRRVDTWKAQARGDQAAGSSASWDRLVGRLVPDRVLTHSFPRMGLTAELRELIRARELGQPVGIASGSRPAGARAGSRGLWSGSSSGADR